MKVLVINCGSSSLKFQLLNMENESLLATGLVERIGIEGSRMVLKNAQGEKFTQEVPMHDHSDALKVVLDGLIHPDHQVLESLDEIEAVGHRVVHGAEDYAHSVLIDQDVMNKLEECVELAPLHNPANILGIKAIHKLMPNLPNVGVFDTAFHQTMKPEAFIYALPYEMYEKHRVRRYGFHGTSHKYVAERAQELLGKTDTKIVTCHLGNGASVTAVKNGMSIDTSMGFTPLEGLVMGTRCGDLDPAIIQFLMKKENLDIAGLDKMMNKQSGMLGISGVSSDFRDIEKAAHHGNERAQLALDIFRRRVRKYIASYAAMMGGLDAVVFTAGLGENSAEDRAEICKGLEFMGIVIDDELNNVRGKEAEISTADSKVKVYMIPTNEELAIARDTMELAKA